MKRFRQNQGKLVQDTFGGHPYYKVCHAVFHVFQASCPSVVTTPYQLFADAAEVLDAILTTGDTSTEFCRGLWTSTYQQYREQEGMTADKEDTQTEVAMLFYAVMFALQAINHSHYRGTLQRLLHGEIHRLYGKNSNFDKGKCFTMEKELYSVVNQYSDELFIWMEDYFASTDSLSQQIERIIHPPKTGRTNKRLQKQQEESVPYTLMYLCKDPSTRVKRIDLVRRKWEEWGWIEKNTDVDDFQHLFDNQPRDCRIRWTANNAILSLTLAKLLDMKTCFRHQTGCSARSIVKNQFKRSYDRHVERVDGMDWLKIDWSVILLDYHQPLELPQLPYRQGEDISDQALQEVFADNMHITKDLNMGIRNETMS